MTTGMLLGPVFQTGYVTNDADRALALFDRRYGINRFLRTGRRSLTLASGEMMTLDICFAWVGDTMVEVIQPLADRVEVYTDLLPQEGFALRLHHVGIRLFSQAEWDQMREKVQREELAIVFELTASNTQALYIDTRADLGHYVEYLYYMDVPNSSLPRIPQNVPRHVTRY